MSGSWSSVPRPAVGGISLTNRVCLVFSTFFGLGFVPWAPGTVATLGAVAVVLFLDYAGGAVFYSVFTAAIIVLSFPLVGRSARILGTDDPPQVVIDEVCGFCVCMLFVPVEPLYLVMGFLLFRFFDILKPPPVGNAESLPGSYGIVMDDVVAGVLSNLCLQVFILLRGAMSG